MRCPDIHRAALAACALAGTCALAAASALASPAEVKGEVDARLHAQLPSIETRDYALGSAAFDEELRAQEDAHADAAKPVLATGAALWKRRFKDGHTLSACFPNGGRRVAVAYPQYHPRLKLVFTLEMAINQCLKAHHEALLDYDGAEMAAITAYVRSLSDGYRVAVRVPGAAQPHFENGRRMYFSRLGQRNFACASCHIVAAGKRYADVPLSPVVGQAARWPFLRGEEVLTLQAQIRACLERMGAAPFPAGSEELNDLEYFLTYLSNGLPIRANAWRP